MKLIDPNRDYGFSDELKSKIEHSIKLIKSAEKLSLMASENGFYLAFSGGKDSQALYHVTELSGVKFHSHMNMTSVDPPAVVRFVKEQYPEVQRHIPEKNFFQLIEKRRSLPSNVTRYCCEVLKEHRGEGYVKLIGIRAEESRKRANRREVETSKWKKFTFDQFSEHQETMVNCVDGKDSILVSPILYWTEQNVWEFLNKIGAPHCSLYDKGRKRIGCVYCPMSNISEMLDYPYRFPHWTNKLKNEIKKLCDSGLYQTLDSNPDLVFAWYISKRTISDFLKMMESMKEGKFTPNKKNREAYKRFTMDFLPVECRKWLNSYE